MVRLDQGKYIGALLAWMQFVKKSHAEKVGVDSTWVVMGMVKH